MVVSNGALTLAKTMAVLCKMANIKYLKLDFIWLLGNV
jgi:hypothetical protein